MGLSRRKFIGLSAAGVISALAWSFGNPLFRPASSTTEPNLVELSASADPNAVIKTRIDPISEEEAKYIVPTEKIASGAYYSLPGRDVIRSIDKPRFEVATGADEWLSDDDFILGLAVDGVARAYPHKIMVWHEIVNDEIRGKPVVVTYCPFCLTGIAYWRVIDGKAVEFGVSGRLYNSNLVMYDRSTTSFWNQITGLAIQGPLSGLKLKRVPLDTIRWGEWKKLHPDTQVFSRETGFRERYGEDPYGSYYINGASLTGKPGYPVETLDSRLPPMAVVVGVEVNGNAKAYFVEKISAVGFISDIFSAISLLVLQLSKQKPEGQKGVNAVPYLPTRIYERSARGQVLDFTVKEGRLFDLQTHSEWNFEGEAIAGVNAGLKLRRMDSGPHFWFAWSNMFPNTELFA